MTLRLKPIVVFSVTKKPDGRLVLNYTRPENVSQVGSAQVGRSDPKRSEMESRPTCDQDRLQPTRRRVHSSQ